MKEHALFALKHVGSFLWEHKLYLLCFALGYFAGAR